MRRTYTYKGLTLTAKEWAVKLNISRDAFYQRFEDIDNQDRIFAPSYHRKPKGKNQRHGKSDSNSYYSWCDMLKRCTNPKSRKYHRYGARGITVHPEWFNFEKFHADMGERPQGTTLDRINNDGNYEPGNCHWATPKQQARNTSLNRTFKYNGKVMTMIEIAEIVGVRYGLLRSRLNQGIPFEKALNKNLLKRGRKKNGLD